MNGLAGQTSFYPPEPAPDPLLCWLWLAPCVENLNMMAEKED